jgi:hypothetical protein
MIDLTEGGLDKAKAFAKRIGKEDNLNQNLAHLQQVDDNNPEIETVLTNDFVPFSFEFYRREKKTGRFRGNGGLIYHGKLENGSQPETFAVQIDPTDGWAIHT